MIDISECHEAECWKHGEKEPCPKCAAESIINDIVEEWHSEPSDDGLGERLGWSAAAYKKWVEDGTLPLSLRRILSALTPATTIDLVEKLENALKQIENVLQSTPENSTAASLIARKHNQALIDIHDISQKALKLVRDVDPPPATTDYDALSAARREGMEEAARIAEQYPSNQMADVPVIRGVAKAIREASNVT